MQLLTIMYSSCCSWGMIHKMFWLFVIIKSRNLCFLRQWPLGMRQVMHKYPELGGCSWKSPYMGVKLLILTSFPMRLLVCPNSSRKSSIYTINTIAQVWTARLVQAHRWLSTIALIIWTSASDVCLFQETHVHRQRYDPIRDVCYSPKLLSNSWTTIRWNVLFPHKSWLINTNSVWIKKFKSTAKYHLNYAVLLCAIALLLWGFKDRETTIYDWFHSHFPFHLSLLYVLKWLVEDSSEGRRPSLLWNHRRKVTLSHVYGYWSIFVCSDSLIPSTSTRRIKDIRTPWHWFFIPSLTIWLFLCPCTFLPRLCLLWRLHMKRNTPDTSFSIFPVYLIPLHYSIRWLDLWEQPASESVCEVLHLDLLFSVPLRPSWCYSLSWFVCDGQEWLALFCDWSCCVYVPAFASMSRYTKNRAMRLVLSQKYSSNKATSKDSSSHLLRITGRMADIPPYILLQQSYITGMVCRSPLSPSEWSYQPLQLHFIYWLLVLF